MLLAASQARHAIPTHAIHPRTPHRKGSIPIPHPNFFFFRKKTRFREEETGWVADGVPLKPRESRRRDGSGGGGGDLAPNGRWVRCRVAPEVIPVATAPARSSRGGFGLPPTSPSPSPTGLTGHRTPSSNLGIPLLSVLVSWPDLSLFLFLGLDIRVYLSSW